MSLSVGHMNVELRSMQRQAPVNTLANAGSAQPLQRNNCQVHTSQTAAGAPAAAARAPPGSRPAAPQRPPHPPAQHQEDSYKLQQFETDFFPSMTLMSNHVRVGRVLTNEQDDFLCALCPVGITPVLNRQPAAAPRAAPPAAPGPPSPGRRSRRRRCCRHQTPWQLLRLPPTCASRGAAAAAQSKVQRLQDAPGMQHCCCSLGRLPKI